MQIVSATKAALVMTPTEKENGWRSFIFDIGIVPLKPTPAKIVITKKIGAYTHTWSMPWSRFLKVDCVDTIVILDKSLMSYTFAPSNPASIRPRAARGNSSKRQSARGG